MRSMVLLRHGETEWSASARLTGRTDIPLSAAGRSQALFTGRALRAIRFNRVLCSPLMRATQTAELLAEGHGALGELEIHDDLVEVGFGDFEGYSARTASAAGIGDAFRMWQALDGSEPMLGAEDLVEAARRVRSIIEEAWSDTTLVVAHGALLRCLTAEMIGLGALRYRRLRLDPCHAMVLQGSTSKDVRLAGANLSARGVQLVLDSDATDVTVGESVNRLASGAPR